MSDKQNGRSEPDELLPARDEESTREQSETPRSYYYDDATGYEIYEDEDETETDEPIDSTADES
jgi:hypothetical protein